MDDSASEPGDAATPAEQAVDAPSPRRVVNPDLLWVESVTERLLGSSEPPTWERAPIGEQVTGAARPAVSDVPAATTLTEPPPVMADPNPEIDRPEPPAAPEAEVSPLPVRTPRPVTHPLSYAEVLADRPRIRQTEEPSPVPYFASTTDRAQTAEQERPAVPTVAPVPPRQPVHSARPTPGEDMPAGVLRAALRDALPDDTARRSSAVDAIFGDPSWRVAAEPAPVEAVAEPAAPGPVPLAVVPPIRQPAPPAPPSVRDLYVGEPLAPRPPTPEPPTVPLSVPAASTAPAPTAAATTTAPPTAPAATGRHRTPDAGDPGTDITAIRMALRSGDEDLAAAVLALVSDRGRERERVRMVEAYLDAVLAEGDDGLAGAARLRRLLSE